MALAMRTTMTCPTRMISLPRSIPPDLRRNVFVAQERSGRVANAVILAGDRTFCPGSRSSRLRLIRIVGGVPH